MNPRELLALLLRVSGENPNSLASKVGVAQSTIQRFLVGTAAQPRASTMKPIAEFFGIPALAFFDEKAASEAARLILESDGKGSTGMQGASSESSPAETHPVAHPKQTALQEETGQILVWETEDDLPEDDERVWVDRWDYFCSAGDGVIQWEIRQKAALPFTKAFFRAISSKPENCRLISVRGRSMEPYLFDRDMAMVDVSKTVIRDGGIYALMFEDESLVKQVFKEPGGALTLHSFNEREFRDKRVEPEMSDTVKVVGEIVYRSGAGLAAR